MDKPKKKRRQRPKESATAIRLTKRRAQVLELRKSGATFREIAATLRGTEGVSATFNEASAYADYKIEMDRLAEANQESAEEVKNLELLRLDRMLSRLEPAINPEDPEAPADPVAVNAALRIMERRSKLLGLDAPAKVAPTTPDGKEEFKGGVLVVPAPMDPTDWDQAARESQAKLKEEGAGD